MASVKRGPVHAFALIPQLARVAALVQGSGAAPADGQFFYCKYLLVDRYRAQAAAAARPEHSFEHLREDATACYDRFSGPLPTESRTASAMRRSQAVASITGFVPAEIAALEAMRKSNHFHYAWSVPYLPFTQQDVNLFEPLMAQTATTGQ